MLKYYSHMVLQNEIEKGVGIITGWNVPKKIEGLLDSDVKNKVRTIGTLYTKNGINYIIANLFLNPNITHLVVLEDSNPDFTMSDSVQAFLHFLETGEATFELKFDFDKEALKEFADYYRNHVSVIKRDKLNEEIRSLDIPKKWRNETHEFNSVEATANRKLPSEKMGFIVRGNTVKEVWLKCIKLIATYGFLKKSDYDEQQLELINLGMVVRSEDLDNPSMVGELGITKEELDAYELSLLNKLKPDGVGYTYGNRFRSFDNRIDQLEYMVNILKNVPFTRRCVATLWNPLEDSKQDEVPCIDLYHGINQDGELYLTAFLRANDILNAFPRNIYGVLKIQDAICKKTGLKKGYVQIIAGSAHIYSRDFASLNDYLNKKISFCEEDDRGYFVIDVKDDHIEVTLYDKNGDTLKVFRGTSATRLRDECCLYVSNIRHACYLGQELMKAELALKNGLNYVQDQPLSMESSKRIEFKQEKNSKNNG